MTRTEKSIVLIAQDQALGARIEAALDQMPGLSVTNCDASLTGLNGKAQGLAQSSDLIIFQAQREVAPDLEALRAIRAAGAQTRILALSDDDAPLATVHALMQAGVAEVLPATVEPAELGEVVSRLTAPRRLNLSPVESRQGKVFAVAKSRGGIGATTFAVNLADKLRGAVKGHGKLADHRAVIVDLDVQFGTVASFLDVPPNQALYRMAQERIDPDATFVDQSVKTAPCGLSVLAAPAGFMPLDALQPAQMAALIEHLRQRFDYVVIDLPHAMVEWVMPVLETCDRMFLVSGTSVPCIQQARRLIDFFRGENVALPIEVVIGQEKRPLIRSRHHTEAAKALDQTFRYWLPPDRKQAEAAMDSGRPLSQTANGSALTKAIGKVAKDIITGAEAPATATPERS